MMGRRVVIAFLASLPTLAVAGAAVAQSEWELLARQRIAVTALEETVAVDPSAGVFSAVGLTMRGNDLYLDRMRLRFDDGDTQEIVVGEVLRHGEQGIFDLDGNTRAIIAIVLIYRRPMNPMADTVAELHGRR
jgi:hypothetical protein